MIYNIQTHSEYMVEEHSKYGTLPQVLRVTFQVEKQLLDCVDEALHDGVRWDGLKPRKCPMRKSRGTLLCLLLLHHGLLDVSTRITNVLKEREYTVIREIFVSKIFRPLNFVSKNFRTGDPLP